MTDLAALFAALAFTSALARRRPVVTPHALAVLACAILYAARVTGGPRVAVAVFAVWPGVAVWLWWRMRKDEGPETVAPSPRELTPPQRDPRHRPRALRVGMSTSRAVASHARRNGDAEQPAEHASAARLAQALWLAYAAALAYGGHHLRAVWPWPILIPNALPLVLALAWWRRPRTWAERAALVLPASCAADLVSTWCGAPSIVREAIGVATWGAYAWATWKGAR